MIPPGTNSDQPLHVVVNAMALRPGGGLTVLMGVLQGLRVAGGKNIRITAICSADDTLAALQTSGVVDDVQAVCRGAGQVRRFLWESLRLSSLVRSLRANLFLTINHFVPRIRIPQVVYHLNLIRFQPLDRSGNWRHRWAERMRHRSARHALRSADANVFESHFLKQAAEQSWSGSIRNPSVIYIGLPDSLLDETEPSSLGRPQSNQLVSITNTHPHKDNPTLMRTLARLVELRPEVDWRLEIAGGLNEALWKPHRELAQHLGVFDRVHWRGFLQATELDSLLRTSLCLISTSRVESFCMVALESMARGCPAVVTSAASMPESVGSAALIVPPSDADEFARAILRIHDEPSLRAKLVDAGKKHIEQFRWSRCGSAFYQLFQQLVPGRP